MNVVNIKRRPVPEYETHTIKSYLRKRKVRTPKKLSSLSASFDWTKKPCNEDKEVNWTTR